MFPKVSSLCDWSEYFGTQYVASTTTTTHTHTLRPHCTDSFCLLQSKKGPVWTKASTREQSIGGGWEITDWSYFLPFADRKPILHSGFSAFCFLQNLQHRVTVVNEVEEKDKTDVTEKRARKAGLKCYLFFNILLKRSDLWMKQRQTNASTENVPIHALQAPWWRPTTCARPKSASRPTATAATAATTRTIVTSSRSSSPRTLASVSCSCLTSPSLPFHPHLCVLSLCRPSSFVSSALPVLPLIRFSLASLVIAPHTGQGCVSPWWLNVLLFPLHSFVHTCAWTPLRSPGRNKLFLSGPLTQGL